MLRGEEAIRIMTDTTRMSTNPVITADQKVITCPGRRRTDNVREGSPGTYEDGDPVNIRLGVLRIGDVALASVDAEIYSPIGMRLKKESPRIRSWLRLRTGGRTRVTFRTILRSALIRSKCLVHD